MISMAEWWDLLTYAIFDYYRSFTTGATVLSIYFGYNINDLRFDALTLCLKEIVTGYDVWLVWLTDDACLCHH